MSLPEVTPIEKAPLQRCSGYSSKLLHKRFQILELRGAGKGFFIIDVTLISTKILDDWKAIVRVAPARDADPVRFTTKAEAEKAVEQLAKSEPITVPQKTAKASVAPSAPKVVKPSMAGRCRELIKEGKLTDDQIFEAVLKDFPTFRRTSVDWYRNK